MVKTEEKRAELTEHLAELRTRLIRIIIYLVIGMIAAWVVYDWLFSLLTKPMLAAMRELDAKFLFRTFPEAFMMRLQVCFISALAVLSPLVVLEIWGFVSPGLTRDEKKNIRWMAPLSTVLFIGGLVLCYLILPTAFAWFSSYVPKNAQFMPDPKDSILFTVKMLAAFGIVFQLPVVLTVLAKVGVVSSGLLKANWRMAIIMSAIIASVATPSGDAFTMLMMAGPVVALYFMSIGMVVLVERKRRKA